jgi:hypothetical protein
MIEDTVRKIEDAILKIRSCEGGDKAELLALLAALKTEVGRLSQTHGEQAHSIASLTELAAHEATRQEKSPDLLRHSRDGLVLSARGFETSHPKLVQTINAISVMLARIGI